MKTRAKLIQTFATNFNLFLQETSPALAQRKGPSGRNKSPSREEVFQDLSKNKNSFSENLDLSNISKADRSNFTGNLTDKMCVLVTEFRDISQPMKNQYNEERDLDEEEGDEDSLNMSTQSVERLDSKYLDKKFGVEKKTAPKTNHANRLVKFTCFDGVNSMLAMEYEKLDIKDFRTGMILSLRPPIEMRKGMMLLKKTNCEVVYKGSEENDMQEGLSQSIKDQAP